MAAPAEDLTPMTARGEATRQKLLEAAEREFGANGFHQASVSAITRAAGVAQGTFYIYFQSKHDIFSELVRHMGASLRTAMNAAISDAPDRMTVERRGLDAFLDFVLDHRDLYRIVQESQFVDETAYREYYQGIARAYARALDGAANRGELRAGDSEGRAWAIMGMGHFLGLRYCIWDGSRPPPDVLNGVTDFIERGMAPPGGGFGPQHND